MCSLNDKISEVVIKVNIKQSLYALVTLSILVTANSLFAKNKTVGEKVDYLIDRTERAAEKAVDNAKKLAH